MPDKKEVAQEMKDNGNRNQVKKDPNVRKDDRFSDKFVGALASLDRRHSLGHLRRSRQTARRSGGLSGLIAIVAGLAVGALQGLTVRGGRGAMVAGTLPRGPLSPPLGAAAEEMSDGVSTFPS